MTSITIQNLLMIVPPLLVMEGFFSGSEIAILSADKLTLQNQARHGARGAKLALQLANRPERVLSTTLVMTSLCAIALSGLISTYFAQRDYVHPSFLAVLVSSPLVVLLGELLPKTLYQRNSTRFAPWVAAPVYYTFYIFYPLTRLLSFYTSRLAAIVGPVEELLSGHRRSTRDDIRALLAYGKKESEIKSSEKRMIRRIFDFKDAEAKHALIPLVRVEAIDETSTVEEALEKFSKHRHSRMPIYSERIDNIIGVLEGSDLFSASDLKQPIALYVSPAHYVAETQALDDLLIEMRLEENEMVVVVDEYGGAVGVITFEDIVEEIVGEIQDEYDSESNLYKVVSENSWLIQAKMEIDRINETLRLDLPSGEYETLSGFLLQQFGRIPEPRDELHFNTSSGSLKFTIRKATERHIDTVLVERLPEE